MHALLFSCRVILYERNSGIHRIATVLRKEGVDVEVLDFASHYDLEILKEYVKQRVQSKTLFFGFGTFFNYWNDTIQQLVDWMKVTYPNIPIVLGGQNVLHTKASKIDYWVDSFADVAIVELAKNLAGNSSNKIFFDASNFGSKKVIKALNSYPAYNLKDYSIIMEKRDYVESYEWLTVEFARGCKFSCAFCNFPILGVKEDTSRTAESFEREIKHNYDNFGVTNYYVADETFNDRTEKIQKFANVVQSLDFNTFFSGFIRADLLPANPEMVTELARMNFGGQYYGIETFTQKAGKIIGKGMDPDRLKNCLLDTKKYMLANSLAYRGTISLIVGLPGETKQDWYKTVDWLKNNWTDEGIVVFPLDVQDLAKDDVSTYTNVSKFSLNLQKYGLREMSTEKSYPYFDRKNQHDFWKSGNYFNIPYIWEHDDMNVFEAMELWGELQPVALNQFKIDNWSLSVQELKKLTKATGLQAEWTESKKAGAKIKDEVKKTFLDNYINKKLS